MIQQSYLLEWSEHYPWATYAQVEQDLILSRAMAEIYSNEFLSEKLTLRGGTALNKLFLKPQSRYSEDIDLVQIHQERIKPVIEALQECLSFLGKSSVKQKRHNNTLTWRYESEMTPVQPMRLKVEINCREHFNVLGLQKQKFKLQSAWYSKESSITTYALEELLGTKLRALYQRRKGRDLFDLYQGLIKGKVDTASVLRSYREYIAFSVAQPPTRKQFQLNMEAKLKDPEFLEDTVALLKTGEKYDHLIAYELCEEQLISQI